MDDDTEKETSAPDDPGRKLGKRVSDKQRAANRANAGRSTGPKTRAGKARSAQNSAIHGIYARPAAIRSGAFAEDPDEIDAFITSMVTALAPRNAIEEHAARCIAVAYLRAARLDRYSAVRIAAASTISTVDRMTTEDEWASFDRIEEEEAGNTDPHVRDEMLVINRLYAALDTIMDLDARVGREIQRSLDSYAKLRTSTDTDIAQTAGPEHR